MDNGLSALRLCVWLFDNFRIELFYIYQNFLFTLGAIKREIFQYRISAQLNSGFIFACSCNLVLYALANDFTGLTLIHISQFDLIITERLYRRKQFVGRFIRPK